MDIETIVLLFSLFAAFCWWFKLQLNENKELLQTAEKEELDRLTREARIRAITRRRE
jgi:hypothetical protein